MNVFTVFRRIFLVLMASVGFGMSISTLRASRISEPGMTFYGQVFQNYRGHRFPATSGILRLNFRLSNGHEHSFETKITFQQRANHNYLLRFPLQWLGYDLSVAPGSIGLTASGNRIEKLTATLGNRELRVLPLVTVDSSLTLTQRGRVQQVFFEDTDTPNDSDSDGLPDGWEDANGFDKWDPSDGEQGIATVSKVTPIIDPDRAQTFVEWRAAIFPNNSEPLNVFETEDADQDGIPNLIEYAFGLNPKHADSSDAASLPVSVREGNRIGVSFRPRSNAKDLRWEVEISDDLIVWQLAGEELEWIRRDGDPQWKVMEKESRNAARFFRVRALRR